MEAIILPDDDLMRLERQFGPAVRRMGSWSSDGVFGYCSVPVSIVERVAGESNDPALQKAVSRLKNSSERARLFVEILRTFGAPLIAKIVTAYRAGAPDPLPETSERDQGITVDWQAA